MLLFKIKTTQNKLPKLFSWLRITVLPVCWSCTRQPFVWIQVIFDNLSDFVKCGHTSPRTAANFLQHRPCPNRNNKSLKIISKYNFTLMIRTLFSFRDLLSGLELLLRYLGPEILVLKCPYLQTIFSYHFQNFKRFFSSGRFFFSFYVFFWFFETD